MTDTIAVIGAGASGTLTALQLLRQTPRPTVLLIGRAGFARGVAYGTDNDVHLLNVPAGKMSAFPDQPDHFLHWAQAHGPAAPGDFLPRRLYGRYLSELLQTTQDDAGDALRLIDDEAVALHLPNGKAVLSLAEGAAIHADRAVLALGNHTPEVPSGLDADLLVADPWAPGALAGIGADDTVLLIGTGLTTIDIVLSLLQAGHRGPIHAVSRRGLLPQPHRTVSPLKTPLPNDLPTDLIALTRLLHRHAKQAMQEGSDWRAVVDALRPHTQRLWQAFSQTDQQRFMRHLRRMWDVHRHRMPEQIAARIEAARRSGQLRIHAGRIGDLSRDGDGITATITTRRGDIILHPACVVNCAGPSNDYAKLDDRLVQDLLRQGLVRPDALTLSLDTAPDGALLDAHGVPSRTLFGIGPVTRARLWEITAVPDIRVQAWDLATRLTHGG